MLFSSIHIRLGRAALNIKQQELAEITGLSLRTIQTLEGNNNSTENANMATIKKIKEAFESKGIKFIYPKDGDGNEGIGIKYYPRNNIS